MVDWRVATGMSFVQFILGFLMAFMYYRKNTSAHKKEERQEGWARLPSGWTHSCGECVGYVSTGSGNPYWWITRRGRTLIEGRAKNPQEAQKEVERALKEFA